MAKTYTPINWQNGTTPINDTNLNHMDNAIKGLYDAKLINKTVIELLTVSDEAPSECQENDLYYNTTSKLLYKATGDNTWGTTGETPTNKYLYVDKTNSKLYYYDGQNFKAYGGGGGINLVTEDGTIPTELFIDTDSFATTGTEVVNSLSGNETNKAPSVKAVNDKFELLQSEISHAKVVYYNPEGARDLGMDNYGFGIYLIVTESGSTIYSFRSKDDATKNSLGSYVKMDGSFGFIGPNGQYPYLLASIDSNNYYPKITTIIKLASFDSVETISEGDDE